MGRFSVLTINFYIFWQKRQLKNILDFWTPLQHLFRDFKALKRAIKY